MTYRNHFDILNMVIIIEGVTTNQTAISGNIGQIVLIPIIVFVAQRAGFMNGQSVESAMKSSPWRA